MHMRTRPLLFQSLLSTVQYNGTPFDDKDILDLRYPLW